MVGFGGAHGNELHRASQHTNAVEFRLLSDIRLMTGLASASCAAFSDVFAAQDRPAQPGGVERHVGG